MAATSFPLLENGHAGLSAFVSEPVSLASLKTTNVAIEWHEGVAIVQELCRVLIASAAGLEVVDLSAGNVTIDREGNVAGPNGIQDGPSAVQQTGELLRSILPNDFPVPLRLTLSQSSSTPPFYVTLTSFSQALEYFERPNRRGIIQSVYRRWDDRAPAKTKQELRKAAEPVTEPERDPEVPASTRAWALPRHFVLMVAIVGGTLLAAVAVFMLTRRVDNPGTGTRAVAASALGAKAVETVGSIASAVMEKLGVPTKPPAVEAAQSIELPLGKATRTAIPRRTGAAPLRSTALIVQVPVRADAPAQTPDTAVFLGEPMPQESAAIVHDSSGSIYSDQDVDVTAPVAVYPQFPSTSEPRPEDAPVFDIVIDSAGAVESVKIRRPPTSVADAMILTMSLSAAKTWRFQPAVKDGRPVRYRKAIWLPPSS